jgi:hypothetical protein
MPKDSALDTEASFTLHIPMLNQKQLTGYVCPDGWGWYITTTSRLPHRTCITIQANKPRKTRFKPSHITTTHNTSKPGI